MTGAALFRRSMLGAALASGALLFPAAAYAQEGGAMVATRRLARGTVLRPADMAPAPATVAGASAAAAAGVRAGWITRRVIRPGELLRPPAVAPRPLVAAGQTVQFIVTTDALHLALDGTATMAGSLGDTVAVRLGAKRRVFGVVTGAAQVAALDSSRTS